MNCNPVWLVNSASACTRGSEAMSALSAAGWPVAARVTSGSIAGAHTDSARSTAHTAVATFTDGRGKQNPYECPARRPPAPGREA